MISIEIIYNSLMWALGIFFLINGVTILLLSRKNRRDITMGCILCVTGGVWIVTMNVISISHFSTSSFEDLLRILILTLFVVAGLLGNGYLYYTVISEQKPLLIKIAQKLQTAPSRAVRKIATGITQIPMLRLIKEIPQAHALTLLRILLGSGLLIAVIFGFLLVLLGIPALTVITGLGIVGGLLGFCYYVKKRKYTAGVRRALPRRLISAETPFEPSTCAICLGTIKKDLPAVKCGGCRKTFHESCAKRVGICPDCGRSIG